MAWNSEPVFLSDLFICLYLYTNTVLDGSVILSVCSFAIETTFLLSNLKTKHIFGILMTLQKTLKLWAPQASSKRGAEGARNMERQRNLIFLLSLSPPPKAGILRVYIHICRYAAIESTQCTLLGNLNTYDNIVIINHYSINTCFISLVFAAK